MNYFQKNITITEEQLELVKKYHKKICNREIAAMIGVTYNKLHNNLRVVGLVKEHGAKVVDFEKDGLFDVDGFKRKYYNY